MKILTNRLLVLLLIIFAASCRQPKELVYLGVQNFNVQAASGKPGVGADIQLYNPNNYKLKLKHANVDVMVNGTQLGKMNLNGKFTVPRKDTFLLPVVLDISLKNALPGMLLSLAGGEVMLKLTGKIHAGRHGVYISIPVDYEAKQPLPQGLKW